MERKEIVKGGIEMDQEFKEELISEEEYIKSKEREEEKKLGGYDNEIYQESG